MFYHYPTIQKLGYVLTGSLLLAIASGFPASAQTEPDSIQFKLDPIKQFVPCMAANPNVIPTVNVTANRGERNDTMQVNLMGFKPSLPFDLFTVEKSPFG
jgi:hypothetical protein